MFWEADSIIKYFILNNKKYLLLFSFYHKSNFAIFIVVPKYLIFDMLPVNYWNMVALQWILAAWLHLYD
jgi:hypothetical protein